LNQAGELAALGTALAFAFSSVFHTLAGQRVGAVILNRMRLLLAIVYLVILHLISGVPLPFHAGIENYSWLGLSGIIGLALGDALLFQAFILIGARLGMLLLSLNPILAALLGWLVFQESLTALQILGIILAVLGVVAVVSERGASGGVTFTSKKDYTKGVFLGLGAAACQAGGLIAARPGLAGGFPPLSATLIRMVAAALIIWGIAVVQKQVRETFSRVDGRSWLIMSGGAFVGPVLGVTLSLYAIQTTFVGVASTLMAMTPVFMLPIGYFIFHERFGWKAIAGTGLAMVGITLLFMA
jgi:drug/metabolite transporter (DMT)-like permease